MIRRNSFAALTLVIVALATACGGGPKQPARQSFLVKVPSECRAEILSIAQGPESRSYQLNLYMEKFRKEHPDHELSALTNTLLLEEDKKEGEDYKGYKLVTLPCPSPS